MRTEPTPQENRAAIDALKAEEAFPEGYGLTDARAGYCDKGYTVVCVKQTERLMQFVTVATFYGTGDIPRFLAEKLARDINAGVYSNV